MRLRNQLLILSLLMFVAILATLYISTNSLLLNGFKRIEQQDIRVDSGRAKNFISIKNKELDRIASDWAAWDDTYRFMGDRNRAFIESNLPDKAVANLDVNFLLFLDRSGRIFHAKAVDIENNREIKLPTGLMDRLTPASRLLQFNQLTDSNQAIIMVNNRLLMLASRQIITSNFTGPPVGYLIVGRFIDDIFIKKLVELTHITIQLTPVSGQSLPSTHSKIVYPDNDTIACESTMVDMDGKTVALMRVDAPRTDYQQGLKTKRTTLFVLVVCGCMFLLILVIYAEATIVRQLEQLGRKAEEIATTPDTNERMPLVGSTELHQLGNSINLMLDSLDASLRLVSGNEEKFRAVLQQCSDAIFMINPDTRMIIQANPAFCFLTGYSLEDLTELYMDTIVLDAESLEQQIQSVLANGEIRFFDQKYRHKNGTVFEVEIAANSVRISDQTIVSFIARDVTNRNRELRHISEMAATDMLTGIPNRRHLMLRAAQEFERTRRARVNGSTSASLCCIMIDIDHFKLINDQYGHHCGDEVLKQCTSRLTCCLRPYDIIGRYGGEEFAVFLSDTSPEQSRVVANRIWDAVRSAPFKYEARSFTVSVSIGISTMKAEDITVDDLMKRSDVMLYTAKKNGRDRIEEAAT